MMDGDYLYVASASSSIPIGKQDMLTHMSSSVHNLGTTIPDNILTKT